MAIGTVMNAPLQNPTNWRMQAPTVTPSGFGDRFTPSTGTEGGLYSLKDLRNVMSADTSQASLAQKQSLFVHDMKAAGLQGVHNPPTPEELKAYFKTFDSAGKREQALDQVQAYCEAFHVHSAEVSNDEDVKYSADKTQYGFDHKVYKTVKEANAAPGGKPNEKIVDIKTADASSWKDVNGRAAAPDGRKIQDCEGFAFMQGELLSAAGFKTQQVATQGDQGYAHAMVLAQDPDSGKYSVSSNAEYVPAGKDNDPNGALQQAWNRATAFKNQGHGDFYYGATQSEAQARMVAQAR